jgi:orotate phosphoribosyltransferase
MIEQARADEIARIAQRILDESNAIIEGDHFVYDSGQHGSGWIDKDVIDEHTDRVERLCALLAEVTRDLRPEVVCGPATGGLVVAQWTAHALGALASFAEHDPQAQPAGPGAAVPDRFVLRRGYDRLVAGKRVLVVDDVINTGLSVRQTVSAVQAAGGQVVGAGALISRGNATAADLGVQDARCLLEQRIPSWPAAGCALCRAGVPINTMYAHGAQFVAQHGQPTATP